MEEVGCPAALVASGHLLQLQSHFSFESPFLKFARPTCMQSKGAMQPQPVRKPMTVPVDGDPVCMSLEACISQNAKERIPGG